MKTRIFFLSFLLGIPCFLFSQDEIGLPKIKPTNDYWGIGYYASVNISIANGYTSDNIVQPGYGGIIEITYNDSKRDLLLIAGLHKLNSKPENEYFEVTEFSVGPRFSIIKNNAAFIEFTVGGLMTSEIKKGYYFLDYNYYYYYKTDPDFKLALTAAYGGKIELSGNTDFIYKLRLISATSFKEDLLSYVSVNTGLSFNTKKDIKSLTKHTSSFVSLALLGGLNSSSFKDNRAYGSGYSYSVEVAYKSSPKIEILMDVNQNRLKSKDEYDYTKYSYTTVTGEGRFLLNESPSTAFIEFGGGFYAFSWQSNYSEANEDYLGFTVGSGAKLNIYNFVDFLAKANLHFLFRGNSSIVPNFLTVQGGVRFHL